jgi:hypothetical protein
MEPTVLGLPDWSKGGKAMEWYGILLRMLALLGA